MDFGRIADMTNANAEIHASGPDAKDPLDPSSIDPDALARMLGLASGTVRRHVDHGAPVNRDGTINLIHYAAWLNAGGQEGGASGD
jgi:hypothetical protein